MNAFFSLHPFRRALLVPARLARLSALSLSRQLFRTVMAWMGLWSRRLGWPSKMAI
jgi:hypothetical protein